MITPRTQQAGAARRRAELAAVAAVLASADLAVKTWAERALADGRSVDLGVAQLRLGYNPGVAFGLGASLPNWVVLGATAVIVAGLAIAAWRWLRTANPGVRIGLTLALAGAVANLLDRAPDGVVTDYLHTGWWPTFNLADVLITGGAAMLLLATHAHPPRRPRSGTVNRQPEGRLGGRGLALIGLTAGWHLIAGVVAVTAGLAANSTALFGFGITSAIGVLAAGVVIWQLRVGTQARQQPALRAIAVTHYILAGYVLLASIRNLLVGDHADESLIGFALLLVALMVMPPIALAQLRTGQATNSPVLQVQATKIWKTNALAVAVLIGLVLNAALGWWWADPMAALIVAALAVQSGREAWRQAGEASDANHPSTTGANK